MDNRGVTLDLDNIFLLNCSKLSSDISIKKLPLSDDELSEIKEYDIRNDIRAKNPPSWTKNLEKINKSKKYYVPFEEKTYHINILSYLSKNLNSNVSDITDVESIFWQNNPTFNSILYLFTDDEKTEKRIYLFKLTKNIRLKDRTIISIQIGSIHKSIKAKMPTTTSPEFTIDKIDSGITLPMNDCISCFYVNNNDMSKSQVEVYDAFSFDDLFSTSKAENKYAMTTVKNFKKGTWKIAQNIVTVGGHSVPKDVGIKVDFEENEETDDNDLVKETIRSTPSVRKPLANYTDNVKRTIKRIGPKELQRLILELNKAVEDENIKVNFTKSNIPKIDLEKKTLSVTPDSLPIFSAMLENKVVEKLLSHEIYIPYYETIRNKDLDMFKDIDWSDKK